MTAPLSFDDETLAAYVDGALDPATRALVEITAGTAQGALVLPVTAVLGRVEQGKVWVVGEDGEPEERTVTLGITDGTVVQITEGLAEGDQVLEFVPGQDVAPADGMAGEVVVG